MTAEQSTAAIATTVTLVVTEQTTTAAAAAISRSRRAAIVAAAIATEKTGFCRIDHQHATKGDRKTCDFDQTNHERNSQHLGPWGKLLIKTLGLPRHRDEAPAPANSPSA